MSLSGGGKQLMIYSRSTEYAIRAFVNLAQVPEGKYAMVKQIAEQEGIPTHFLAKILQQLARKGLLRSSKGPTGGFTLRAPAAEISIIQLVEALDGLTDYQKCVSGLAECNDDQPCGMHDSWKALRSRIMEYLEQTTIADLAAALEQKRKAMEKPRRGRKTAAAGKKA
jgi:Rrf2 family transcriptional regulator, iron-sulfur cluster assembly transcription factor